MPTVVGVNVTLIVQLEFAARLLPQVLVSAKPAVTLMLFRVRLALPPFVKVNAAGVLVEFRTWLLKV